MFFFHVEVFSPLLVFAIMITMSVSHDIMVTMPDCSFCHGHGVATCCHGDLVSRSHRYAIFLITWSRSLSLGVTIMVTKITVLVTRSKNSISCNDKDSSCLTVNDK